MQKVSFYSFCMIKISFFFKFAIIILATMYLKGVTVKSRQMDQDHFYTIEEKRAAQVKNQSQVCYGPKQGHPSSIGLLKKTKKTIIVCHTQFEISLPRGH